MVALRRQIEKMVHYPPMVTDPALVSILLTLPYRIRADIRLLVRILRVAPVTESLDDGLHRKTAFLRQFLDLLSRN